LHGECLQGTCSFALGLFSSSLRFKTILFHTENKFRLGDITGVGGWVGFVIVLAT
jgi:hypothetical protein